MIKYIKKLFSYNLGIKIFCIIAATLLWIYIAAGQGTVAKYPGSIKIKAINVPSDLVAIYDTKTVDIKIMAEPTVWKKLSVDSFSAFVDLAGQGEGTYELPVNVVSSVSGVDVVEKTPDRIVVSLEPVISKDVVINQKVVGSAAEGLVAGSIDLSPDKTKISGPKSIIEGISEATAEIKLNGESEKFTKTVKIVAFDENGETINNLEFTPSETTATVTLVKAANNKTVGVRVKIIGTPLNGYYISNISVNPTTVDITGQSGALSDVLFVETLAVDVTNLSTNLEKDIALSIKSGYALQAGSPSKVHIIISFLPNQSSKEISATIVPINLKAGYQVTSISPSEIKVVCTGPLDAITKLKSSDIIFNPDFSGKTLTDSTFSFSITPSSFKTPTNIDVVSALPNSINVTVAKK